MPLRRISGQFTVKDGQGIMDARVDNTGDGTNYRLFTDAIVQGDATGSGPATTIDGTKSAFRDFNSTTGDTLGVDRDDVIGTVFEKLWARTGSGIVFSGAITMESPTEWQLKVIIDGVGGNPLIVNDFLVSSIYNLKLQNGFNQDSTGLYVLDDTMFLNGPLGHGLTYKTSIEFQALTSSGLKKFKAGFVRLTEVT